MPIYCSNQNTTEMVVQRFQRKHRPHFRSILEKSGNIQITVNILIRIPAIKILVKNLIEMRCNIVIRSILFELLQGLTILLKCRCQILNISILCYVQWLISRQIKMRCLILNLLPQWMVMSGGEFQKSLTDWIQRVSKQSNI